MPDDHRRLTRAQLRELRERAANGPRSTNLTLGLNAKVEVALVRAGLLTYRATKTDEHDVVITDAGLAALAAQRREPASSAGAAPPRTSLPLTSGVSAANPTESENR